MPKIQIVDDIFAPEDRIVINFTGQNPFKVCQIIRPMFEKIMQVESKDMFERIFKWDITDDPRSFYNFWTVRREEDRWTCTVVKAIFQGKQHSKTGEGNVRIDLSGWIETNYEYSNFLQRALWLIYNRMFYYKRRRQYLDRGREFIFMLRDEIMRELRILRIA